MDSGSAASVSDLVSCQVCWAAVERPLMVFHRQWHDRADRSSTEGLPDLTVVPVVEPRRNASSWPAVLESCQPD